jgi:hypothetical protein
MKEFFKSFLIGFASPLYFMSGTRPFDNSEDYFLKYNISELINNNRRRNRNKK